MNPLRRIPQTTALLGLLALGAAAPAQTQSYAQKTKTIRAAVLLLDADNRGPSNLPTAYGMTAAPYAFYNLDQAEGIKPGGWNFVNPSAPGAVTTQIRNRYVDGYGAATGDIPDEGTLITKRSGAYWTVSLSQLSDSQIADFDVLLIAPRTTLSINAYERERLRRFVDGGGTLWVDMYGAGVSAPYDLENNLPFSLQRLSGAADVNAYRDVTSPVLDGPRRLTGGDLQLINRSPILPSSFYLGAIPTGTNNRVPLIAEFLRYRTVAAVDGAPVISEARLGSGTIVVTARGAAQLLNQATALLPVGDTTNSNIGFYGLDPKLNPTGRAAARLGINIVALSGGFSQPGGSARKTGSATQDPGSPVLPRFTAENSYGPPDLKTGVFPVQKGVPQGAPVTYKGFLVASVRDDATGKYRVVVFDAVPGRDADGDGDEDDGIVDGAGAVQNKWRDTSVGKALDVVWVSRPLDSEISSPVCAEVPEARALGGAVDQVLVTDAQGTLHIFQLAPRNGVTGAYIGGDHTELARGGQNDGTVEAPAGTFPITGQAIIPPTVYDGLAYIADSAGSPNIRGRIWVVDLSTGVKRYLSTTENPDGLWLLGGADATGVPMPSFTASPTIGYIPIQDSTGGLDRVLYAPGVVNPGTNNSQAAFVSAWLGAKGEKPRVEVQGGTVKLITRAGTNGQLPIYFPQGGDLAVMQQMGFHVSISDQNGNPLNLALWLGTGPTQSGPGELVYSTGRTQAEFDDVNVRVDYSIDWGADPKNLSGQIVRGRLLMPTRRPAGGGLVPQRILGPIALTSRGTLHLTQAPSDPGAAGGTYWAIREDAGRGSFRIVSRYSLYSKYSQAAGQQTYSVPQVLEDVDGVQTQFPDPIKNDTKFNDFSSFRFAGGVAVRNGVAYTTINATRGSFNIPVTMVAAFRAEPETPELRLGSSIGKNARIYQVDFARSNPGALVQTPTTSTLTGDRLNIDFENGIIRLENLATVTREEITDCLSLSQPIAVDKGGSTELRYPDEKGDRWSPLLWFGLWNGGKANGAPLVAGNEVFIAADTSLINILETGTFATNGVVWSVDADAPTTGNFALPLPKRPWIIQQAQIKLAPFEASPYYRMPQNRGVRSFDDWRLRLAQTKLGASTVAGGVAGGEGIVAAWGDRGVYGLSRADFVVCDEGRLLRVDSNGNAVSNTFGGRFSGVGGGGGVAEMRPLVRPVKAYPVGTNEFLVVDAGGNRVVRLDDDGAELRSIDRITLDPAYKPAAYRVNEPLTLKDPRDAATYEGYVYLSNGQVVSNQRPIEYWVRYIVADAGHGRIVELADRYAVDATTGQIQDPISIDQVDPETNLTVPVPQVGVLVWQSPSLEQAAKLGDYYHSIQRVFVGDLGTGRYVYVAGVGRTRPTRSSAGLDAPDAAQKPSAAAGGAIVLFDPLGGVRVFDRFQTPNLANTKFLARPLDPVATQFDLTATSRPPLDNRPFSGLAAVTASTYVDGAGLASIRIMATDADAVYEFVVNSAVLANASQDPTQSTNGTGALAPSWMMNEAAFTALRSGDNYGKNPRFFRPAFARRLDSGDVLIVNGYRGLTRDGISTYSGEVALVDGFGYDPSKQNLNFTLSSLRFELPPLSGIRGLLSPVFADRR